MVVLFDLCDLANNLFSLEFSQLVLVQSLTMVQIFFSESESSVKASYQEIWHLETNLVFVLMVSFSLRYFKLHCFNLVMAFWIVDKFEVISEKIDFTRFEQKSALLFSTAEWVNFASSIFMVDKDLKVSLNSSIKVSTFSTDSLTADFLWQNFLFDQVFFSSKKNKDLLAKSIWIRQNRTGPVESWPGCRYQLNIYFFRKI